MPKSSLAELHDGVVAGDSECIERLADLMLPMLVRSVALRRAAQGSLFPRDLIWDAAADAVQDYLTYPMHVRLEPSAACAGVSGACLEFVPENGSSIFMVIDAHTGQPRAIVTSLRAAGSRGGPMTLYSVDRLYDYRPVDGLQVPFRVERQVTGPGVPDLGAPAVETYDAVRVNPPLIAADFAGQ